MSPKVEIVVADFEEVCAEREREKCTMYTKTKESKENDAQQSEFNF